MLDRLVHCHTVIDSWLYWAKFEEKQHAIGHARAVYERCVGEMAELANDQKLFIAFAEFEVRAKEYERARAIYKYALDHIPKALAQDLFKKFAAFEKQYGNRGAIEDVIVSKRRFEYEEEVKSNPSNYDVWFDYLRLEESQYEGTIESNKATPAEIRTLQDRLREVYERAIGNVPPVAEKRTWRRYIFLWIKVPDKERGKKK